MSFNLNTATEICKIIADRVRQKRLEQNLSQEGLSARSGVNICTLRVFERTGKIAFEKLIKIAMALRCVDDLTLLFSSHQKPASLFTEEKSSQRKRGTLK